MPNPNNCSACDHKEHPDGGHCYMFRFAPDGPCAHHSFRVEAIRAMRMQFVSRVMGEVLKRS